MQHNTHGFEIEENEHDVVDKDYPEIKARVQKSEWVVKLRNQAGEEWKTRCTEHFAWQAADYIEELEKELMVFRTGADLFEVGDFTSHAGLPLAWKIECDAIRPEWWKGLARMIMDYQTTPFSRAEGIPRGGCALGEALNEYASGNPQDPVLIADDVYTTGTSFREYCDEHYPDQEVIKWCAFARKPTDDGVHALFTMPQTT